MTPTQLRCICALLALAAAAPACKFPDQAGLIPCNDSSNCPAELPSCSSHAAGATGRCVAAAPAALLALSDGDGQSGAAGGALPRALAVLVSDSKGNPVTGASVAWAAATGGGSVAPAASSTGPDGIATATATLGAKVGGNTFTATAGGLAGSPVTFTATGVAGPAAKLARISPADGFFAAGTSQQLVVLVGDANDNPVAGATVTWAKTAGGGSIAAASTTGADGKAQATATLGATAGANTFTARVGQIADSPVTFSLTGVGQPAKLVRVSPADGSFTASSQQVLTVLVTDLADNPVSGAAVSWAKTAGNGSFSASSSTGPDGKASATATLDAIVGTNTFTATSGQLAGSPVTFTLTGVAGPAASQTKVAADNQNLVPSGTVPLTIKVRDINGNVVQGASVAWAATAGGGSSVSASSVNTLADGTSSVTATMGSAGGQYTFTAAAAGVGGTLTFTENVPAIAVSPTPITLEANKGATPFQATLILASGTPQWSVSPSSGAGTISPSSGGSTSYTPPSAVQAPTAVTVNAQVPPPSGLASLIGSAAITLLPYDQFTNWKVPANGAANTYGAPSSGTIADSTTGLVWEQGFSASEVDRATAISRCAGLNLGGVAVGTWRLPTQIELLTLVDPTKAPAISTSFSIPTPAQDPNVNFWSSTDFKGNPTEGWVVQFRDGQSVVGILSQATPWVRCVR